MPLGSHEYSEFSMSILFAAIGADILTRHVISTKATMSTVLSVTAGVEREDEILVVHLKISSITHLFSPTLNSQIQFPSGGMNLYLKNWYALINNY